MREYPNQASVSKLKKEWISFKDKKDEEEKERNLVMGLLFGKKKNTDHLTVIHFSGEHLTIVVSHRDKGTDTREEANQKVDELLSQGWSVATS